MNEILDYLKTCEVKIISLENDQPLAIVIKSDDIDQSTLEQLQIEIKTAYENMTNKIAIFGISPESEVDFYSMKEVLEIIGCNKKKDGEEK